MSTNNIGDSQKLVELSETLGVDIPGVDYDGLDDLYDDMLNETAEETEILGCKIIPADYLKENDPTAYRCGKCDWLDGELTDNLLFEIGDMYLTEEELETFKDDLSSAISDLM